jgi:hypothetical protein
LPWPKISRLEAAMKDSVRAINGVTGAKLMAVRRMRSGA